MKALFPFIFPLVFLGILSSAVIYLSKRMHFFFETSSVWIWYTVFTGLLIFMVAGVIGLSNSTTIWGSLVYKLAAFTMGLLLYFLMAVLLVHLFHQVVKFSPRISGFSAIALTVFVLGLGVLNSFYIRTTHIDIPLKGLTKKVRAVHLSDVHIGHFRGIKWMQQMVDKTNAQNPEVVFITGDLFDGRINLTREVLEPLKSIVAPIFFVDGNHDGYTGVKQIKLFLKDAGIRVLENEVAQWNELQIVGLNHMRADSATGGMHASHGATMKEVFPTLKIEKDRPTLLLHHSPDGMEYANQYGIGLYLSGHTHGGQQFPVTLINELLFKYNRGLDEYKGTKILVSEGVGTFGPPVRVGTRSEIIVINLTPEK